MYKLENVNFVPHFHSTVTLRRKTDACEAASLSVL
ncbi:MAG: hypothetical protein KatS3mg072_1904 [Meiothermus sp.]|nr:MAG: hypothetical protein KatS3mg072_1904 [Meiothermus sp.]